MTQLAEAPRDTATNGAIHHKDDDIFKSGERFSRREFLRRAKAYVWTILISAAVSPFLMSHKNPVDHTPYQGYLIHPGWKNKYVGKNTPFFSYSRGHNDYLTEMVMNNPIILPITHDLMAFTLQKRDEGIRLDPAQSFGQAINITTQHVSDLPKRNIWPDMDWQSLIVDVGITAHTMSLNTLMREGVLQKLGVTGEEAQDVPSFFWNLRNGYAIITAPLLFGYERHEVPDVSDIDYWRSYAGPDRGIHWAHNLFIVHELLRHDREGTLDQAMMPKFAKIPRFLAPTYEKRATYVAWLANYLHEAAGTIVPGKLPLIQSTFPAISRREGFLEVGGMIEADFKGNQLGMETAIRLAQFCREGKDITPVLNQLADPRYRHFKTPATLDLPPAIAA